MSEDEAYITKNSLNASNSSDDCEIVQDNQDGDFDDDDDFLDSTCFKKISTPSAFNSVLSQKSHSNLSSSTPIRDALPSKGESIKTNAKIMNKQSSFTNESFKTNAKEINRQSSSTNDSFKTSVNEINGFSDISFTTDKSFSSSSINLASTSKQNSLSNNGFVKASSFNKESFEHKPGTSKNFEKDLADSIEDFSDIEDSLGKYVFQHLLFLVQYVISILVIS